MKMRLGIAMDNAAFADGNASETARILAKLAEWIQRDIELIDGDEFPLFDYNGNKVGTACISND